MKIQKPGRYEITPPTCVWSFLSFFLNEMSYLMLFFREIKGTVSWEAIYPLLLKALEYTSFCTKNSTNDTSEQLPMSSLMTKPTRWHVRPAKTQISQGICPVWSESLLSTWRKLGSLATYWVQIWVFAGCTCYSVGFVIITSKVTGNKYLKKAFPSSRFGVQMVLRPRYLVLF